jgi:hypothetical protein
MFWSRQVAGPEQGHPRAVVLHLRLRRRVGQQGGQSGIVVLLLGWL